MTESGIVRDIKEEQSLNADSPIEVTESGIVMDAKCVQPLKA